MEWGANARSVPNNSFTLGIFQACNDNNQVFRTGRNMYIRVRMQRNFCTKYFYESSSSEELRELKPEICLATALYWRFYDSDKKLNTSDVWSFELSTQLIFESCGSEELSGKLTEILRLE